MDILTYIELLVSFTGWMPFMILNSIYNAIRGLWWRRNGVHWQIISSKEPENYGRCAQIKRILFRYTIDGFTKVPECVFVTVHEGFARPKCMFQDDCSLYSITSTEAVFIQVKSSPDDALSADFPWLGQYNSAWKLIAIPLNQFNKLAEQMEGDDARNIFLYNQARCVGTLWQPF